MTLDHAAIWTSKLEELRTYYSRYFGGVPNEKYVNEAKGFQSYFLSFESGARLEIMSRPDIQERAGGEENTQYKGITHLAFGVKTMQEVDEKARELKAAGFRILSGPRKTGDGYYEFETVDPDCNRVEVTTAYSGE